MAGAGVDRVRDRGHQAAALRAAAVSGDCNFDRRHAGAARAGPRAVDGARHRVVVRRAGDFIGRGDHSGDHAATSAGVRGLAVCGGVADFRIVRVVDV